MVAYGKWVPRVAPESCQKIGVATASCSVQVRSRPSLTAHRASWKAPSCAARYGGSSSAPPARPELARLSLKGSGKGAGARPRAVPLPCPLVVVS
jgi:hypothetical protein